MIKAQLRCLPKRPSRLVRHYTRVPPAIVKLEKATFYRQYPSEGHVDVLSNPPVFPRLTFKVSANEKKWAVVSPSSLARTTFLQVLDGQLICVPPNARSYPYLSADYNTEERLRNPKTNIKYIGFDAQRGGLGGTSLQGAYLSARYESRKEETDWSLQDYLEGNTELNAIEKEGDGVDKALLEKVIKNFRLNDLLSMPVSNLSNGQTRRARIAKALLGKPELLLLDGPFMGLDPPSAKTISRLLQELAEANAPSLILSLRPEDELPDWITHVVYINSNFQVISNSTKLNTSLRVGSTFRPVSNSADNSITRDGFPKIDPPNKTPGEVVVEMQGVKVSYGSQGDKAFKTVLGDWSQEVDGERKQGLWWNVRRGERWGVFGPNGSGKTTLLSLITSDHPQTYSLPIKLFGKSRLPDPGEPGISVFELQSRMGHASPEVHTYFPKSLTVRRVLESAWADAPLSKPNLSHQVDRRVDAFLRWFAAELSPDGVSELELIARQVESPRRGIGKSGKRTKAESEADLHAINRLVSNSNDIDWADTLRFRDLSFSGQRLALFLRALVAQPDLIILDEAFSGLDGETRDKCLQFLSHGETKSWDKGAGELKPSFLARRGKVVFEGINDQQALLLISHSETDVPGCVRQWICLPEPGEGKPARRGSLGGPLELNPGHWNDIWGIAEAAQSDASSGVEASATVPNLSQEGQ